MPTAKQLPSGTWRCRVYSHKDNDGKVVYMSFTASTKREAEMKAMKFIANKERRSSTGGTVETVIEDYITAKSKVLSPSTIRSYRGLQKKYYKEIAKINVHKLTNKDVQTMISNLTAELSAKSIKNVYALLTAAIAFYSKDITFNVTLPSAIRKTAPAPTNADVILLYKHASPWLQKCIALAAFGGLRRGEIAALRYGDIQDDKVYIHCDYVMNENNRWVLKPMPKNMSSVRYVRLPKKVIELLGEGRPDEFIIKYNPNTISKMFIKLYQKLDIQGVRFHDLRHFYASIGAVLQIPDIVLADFGGWRHDSPIMKNTYQGNITDISEGYSRKMSNYFDEMLN